MGVGHSKVNGGGRGGHAWVVPDWIGDDFWMLNSHGVNWGQKGWARITRRFIDQLHQSRYTAVAGITDMDVPEVRDFSWLKDHYL